MPELDSRIRSRIEDGNSSACELLALLEVAETADEGTVSPESVTTLLSGIDRTEHGLTPEPHRSSSMAYR